MVSPCGFTGSIYVHSYGQPILVIVQVHNAYDNAYSAQGYVFLEL